MNRLRDKATPQEAELLAVAVLSFLAEEPDRLAAFLGETGLDPENLRAAASTPGFLPSVLDYLIGHEDLLLEFAASQEMDPARIPLVRRALPGGRFEP